MNCGDVSIITITRNGIEHTQRFLLSLARWTPEYRQLIVVDNGSADGTVDWLEEHARQELRFRLIFNKENVGFGIGANQGIVAAEGGPVVIANNDAVVTPEWLTRLVACANRHPGSGIIGPMTNYASGAQAVCDVDYDKSSLLGLDQFAQDWAGRYSGQSVPCWRIIGFCMLILDEVVQRIGGFDPVFGLGTFEDDDYCIRTGIAGFAPRIAADCYVHHAGSQTFRSEKLDTHSLMLANWSTFKQKWDVPETMQNEEVVNHLLLRPYDRSRHFISLCGWSRG